jgi:hypothetical protein
MPVDAMHGNLQNLCFEDQNPRARGMPPQGHVSSEFMKPPWLKKYQCQLSCYRIGIPAARDRIICVESQAIRAG